MSPRTGIGKPAVLKAAGDLADEIGLENVSIAAIAKKIGVKAPSMYNYLEGLESLRRELSLLGLSVLTERLTGASIGKSGFDLLHSVAEAQKDMTLERPGLYSVSVAANTPGDEELNALWQGPVRIFRAVIQSYGIEGEEGDHATRVLRTSVHGFALVNSIDGFRLGADPDQTFERLVASIHHSLSEWNQVSNRSSVS